VPDATQIPLRKTCCHSWAC